MTVCRALAITHADSVVACAEGRLVVREVVHWSVSFAPCWVSTAPDAVVLVVQNVSYNCLQL